MTQQAELIKEIETLPANCVGEVIDFVAWIKQRKLLQIPETMLLSETSLSKDWDTPEEDEAWKAMAADTEREREAGEWCNAYFGPAHSKPQV
jgi:hypothetical protein